MSPQADLTTIPIGLKLEPRRIARDEREDGWPVLRDRDGRVLARVERYVPELPN